MHTISKNSDIETLKLTDILVNGLLIAMNIKYTSDIHIYSSNCIIKFFLKAMNIVTNRNFFKKSNNIC